MLKAKPFKSADLAAWEYKRKRGCAHIAVILDGRDIIGIEQFRRSTARDLFVREFNEAKD